MTARPLIPSSPCEEEIAPQVTRGTNPAVISVNDIIPDPASFSDPVERASAEKALVYGLTAGRTVNGRLLIAPFIGFPYHRVLKICARRRKSPKQQVAPGVQALVVPPGSGSGESAGGSGRSGQDLYRSRI